MRDVHAGTTTWQEESRTLATADADLEAAKKDMDVWRSRLKGMQAVKVSLFRKELRKRGQLDSV